MRESLIRIDLILYNSIIHSYKTKPRPFIFHIQISYQNITRSYYSSSFSSPLQPLDHPLTSKQSTPQALRSASRQGSWPILPMMLDVVLVALHIIFIVLKCSMGIKSCSIEKCATSTSPSDAGHFLGNASHLVTAGLLTPTTRYTNCWSSGENCTDALFKCLPVGLRPLH